MSYWTVRRKLKKSVAKHINEVENEFSETSQASNVYPDLETSTNENEFIEEVANSPLSVEDGNVESEDDSSNDYFHNDLLDSNDFNDDLDLQESYFLRSDTESESSENENLDDASMSDQLSEWAVNFGITMEALSVLLRILQPVLNELPKDPRTLLKTTISYNIQRKCGGEYYHFGIKQNIINILSAQSEIEPTYQTLQLQINIDGLPLLKSSNNQFWPILGRLVNIPSKEPFVIGIFSGTTKPTNLSDYLKDFINEFNELKENGMTYCDEYFKIAISSVICDAPAKAFVKNIKQYSGYYGCDKCAQEGEWRGKMTFPEINAPLRTDQSFQMMTDEEHHKGPSPLSDTGLKMITQFPIDYMHMTCLGVVKRMLLIWMKGPLNNRLNSRTIQQISSDLVHLRPFIPSEFARKPRSLCEIDRWKATEFRQFLLYTGPVVLEHHLHENLYKNVLLFSVSLHILLNSFLVEVYSGYANELLAAFVEHFGQIYGGESLVYNVHGPTHLAADAKQYGTLDNISSFPFENYLKKLKKMVRKPSFLLSQVIRRLSENRSVKVEDDKYEFKKEHSYGPVPHTFVDCKQYHCIKTKQQHFCVNEKDSCIRIGDEIAKIVNFVVCDYEVYVVYRFFKRVRQFFSVPLDSQLLGIHIVSDLRNAASVDKLSAVQAKCVLLLYTGITYVVILMTDSVW